MRTALRKFSELVKSEEFLKRHRTASTYFTRRRKLPFASVFAIVLRKSVKSLQVVLNEWCRGTSETISASALSQARQKFRHTAFIELLEECVIRPTYDGKKYKRFRGHRLLARDGSTLHLPTSKELIDTFGTVRRKRQYSTMCLTRYRSQVPYMGGEPTISKLLPSTSIH